MITHLYSIANFMWIAFLHIWPYLLITIPIAVAVRMSNISDKIGRVLEARPLIAILAATAIGAFSPFCSCGIIPVIWAMLVGGVPLAPVMSFWLASPSMDPEIFFLSVSTIGWELALWRLAGTFTLSLAGGFITHLALKRAWL
ncbi:MAG: permease [Fidelibacterota bacterium]|nr:MAG: permease [Candidatus Neomarinimicrobiota bacterium]